MIRGVAEGDNQALAALYDATSRTIYGLLLRIPTSPSSRTPAILRRKLTTETRRHGLE